MKHFLCFIKTFCQMIVKNSGISSIGHEKKKSIFSIRLEKNTNFCNRSVKNCKFPQQITEKNQKFQGNHYNILFGKFLLLHVIINTSIFVHGSIKIYFFLLAYARSRWKAERTWKTICGCCFWITKEARWSSASSLQQNWKTCPRHHPISWGSFILILFSSDLVVQH